MVALEDKSIKSFTQDGTGFVRRNTKLYDFRYSDVKEAVKDFKVWSKYNKNYYEKDVELELHFLSKYNLKVNDYWLDEGIKNILGDFKGE